MIRRFTGNSSFCACFLLDMNSAIKCTHAQFLFFAKHGRICSFYVIIIGEGAHFKY